MRTHKDLHVWQKAIRLADRAYDITARFPKEEIFGLSSQMRRAAVSVASNIAEGSARSSKKEFAQFLSISRGSLAELETQLLIAHRRNFINKQEHDLLAPLIEDVGKMLTRLVQSLKT